MLEYFEIILQGFQACFAWFEQIKIGDFSILDISLVVLFLTCCWRFLLSPIFGVSGGSLSVGVSDRVGREYARAQREEEIKNRRRIGFY